jgi:hypothetical protein
LIVGFVHDISDVFLDFVDRDFIVEFFDGMFDGLVGLFLSWGRADIGELHHLVSSLMVQEDGFLSQPSIVGY